MRIRLPRAPLPLLRKELAEGTPLGEQAREIIASGDLVSDEIIVQIIEKKITTNPGAAGFLFDGFPRTFVQAYILEGLLLKLSDPLAGQVHVPGDAREALDLPVREAEAATQDPRLAGVMTRPAEEVESFWLTHFGVADLRQLSLRASPLGAAVLL